MAFNPNEHITPLKGKDYLEVKWRLCWFRDHHPHGTIETSMLHLDHEGGIAVFKAVVSDGEGGIGSGHGSETRKDFADFIEKAETKAIGRALAALGFGTQFAPELEEGERLADSPVERRTTKVSLDALKKMCDELYGPGRWQSVRIKVLPPEEVGDIPDEMLSSEQLGRIYTALMGRKRAIEAKKAS